MRLRICHRKVGIASIKNAGVDPAFRDNKIIFYRLLSR